MVVMRLIDDEIGFGMSDDRLSVPKKFGFRLQRHNDFKNHINRNDLCLQEKTEKTKKTGEKNNKLSNLFFHTARTLSGLLKFKNENLPHSI